MNSYDLQNLNQQFELQADNNHLSIIEGKGGLPVIDIDNELGRALISLQGAHLLSWIPKGEDEVIWLSKDATFAAGKSVRGGIPVCWPWFGAHDLNADFPAHGFARTSSWHIIATEALANGTTRVTLTLKPQAENEHMWLADTGLQYQITIGSRLELELITHNRGTKAITLGQALHTYFNVSDVSKVFLLGLDRTDYLDKLDGFKRKHQVGPVTFSGEVDRVYVDTFTDCIIEDIPLKRNIIIKKVGSHSTVVWNPWQETARKMGDLGENGYKTMLCVETSNAEEDTVTIEPQDSHQLWVQYQVQRLE